MRLLQVKCIIKTAPGTHPSHITHIGNHDDSSPWMYTREEAIQWITSGFAGFYVQDLRSGEFIEVRVVRAFGEAPYLRTTPDHELQDNLLQLPSCRRLIAV